MGDQFEPVKLRSPRGNLHTAHTPREVNDLVFGQGYTVVGKRDVADVLPTSVAAQEQAQIAVDKPAPQPKKETTPNG